MKFFSFFFFVIFPATNGGSLNSIFGVHCNSLQCLPDFGFFGNNYNEQHLCTMHNAKCTVQMKERSEKQKIQHEMKTKKSRTNCIECHRCTIACRFMCYIIDENAVCSFLQLFVSHYCCCSSYCHLYSWNTHNQYSFEWLRVIEKSYILRKKNIANIVCSEPIFK